MKIATSFLALAIEEAALSRITKNLRKEARRLPFHGLSRAYRPLLGLALAPSRRLKGCRAGHRASSLTAALDSSKLPIQLLTCRIKATTPLWILSSRPVSSASEQFILQDQITDTLLQFLNPGLQSRYLQGLVRASTWFRLDIQ